jgi:hypothetical protein
VLFPHLDERQRRLLMGAEAQALGHGGVRLVARAAGVREATVALGRARRAGGGRKRVANLDRGLRPALLGLVEPDMRAIRCHRCGGRRSRPASWRRGCRSRGNRAVLRGKAGRSTPLLGLRVARVDAQLDLLASGDTPLLGLDTSTS